MGEYRSILLWESKRGYAMITLLEKYNENNIKKIDLDFNEKYVETPNNIGSFFEYDDKNKVLYNAENEFEGSKVFENMRLQKF